MKTLIRHRRNRPNTLPAVLVVMGMSGSGKTTIASLLEERLQWEFQDGDWHHPAANVEKMQADIPLSDEDRRPWLESIGAWLDETRRAGQHGVVACSALKRAYRDILIGNRDDVCLIYLQGERDLIARHMAERSGHFMPTTLLDSQLATLEEPSAEERPLNMLIDAAPQAIVGLVVEQIGGCRPRR